MAISRVGIALQAPALRALRALGLRDAVVEQGFGMTAFRYHDATSTKRAETELPRLAGPEPPGRGRDPARAAARDPARRRARGRRRRPARHDRPVAQMYLFAVQPQPEFARVPAEEEPALMRELLAEFSGLIGELRERIADPEQIVRRRSRRSSLRRRGIADGRS